MGGIASMQVDSEEIAEFIEGISLSVETNGVFYLIISRQGIRTEFALKVTKATDEEVNELLRRKMN